MLRLVCLLSFAAACGRISADGPGELDPDGGSLSDGDLADAGGPDVPAFGPVDVTFLQGTPQANAKVFVYDAQGDFLRETVTGADGRVVLEDVPRGGSITVGDFIGGAPRMASVYGVQPNDVLVLGSRGLDQTETTLTATSTLPAPHHYLLGGACGGHSQNLASVRVQAHCQGESGWPIVAYAFSDATTVSHYMVVPSATAGAPMALNAWKEGFELDRFTLGWSNLLPGAMETVLQFFYPWPSPSNTYVTSTAASGDVDFLYAGEVVDALSYRVTANFADGAWSAFFRTITPIRMEIVNQQLLMFPPVSTVAGDFTDTVRPTITWSTSGDFTTADTIALHLQWDGPGFYDWNIQLPNGVTSFRLPAIPLSHVQLQPPAGMGWNVEVSVEYIDVTDKTWDQIRGQSLVAQPQRSAGKSFQKVF
jgi:hypothetical protein